jgi:hypothetical protein
MTALLAILCRSSFPFPEDVDWNSVLDLAEEQHVLPIVARYLRQADCVLPQDVDKRVTQIEQDCAQGAFWWTSELRGVLEQFGAEGIDTILLKGPSFAERIYGSPRLRLSSDLDVLVRSTRLQQARESLARQGFEVTQQDNGYHEGWVRDTTALELHHDVAPRSLFDFHIETAWQRALPASFAGQPTLCFEPMDELLFLCIHGTRHCFDHLGHVLDVALFLDHLVDQNLGAPLQMLGRPDTQHLAGLLVFSCELARRLHPGKPWTLVYPGTLRQQKRLQTKAEKHWHELLTLPPPNRRWTSIRRFYRNMEWSWHGQVRSAMRDIRDGATLVIEADYEFAQRLQIAEHRRWSIYLARYLRLASKHARSLRKE